ncbi:hypothetical protein ACIBQ5_23285 [Streptomyces massasporeus]|uniref:hypothetical protein n=1 Tax=Streptomyces massasporeus TaxID=67324 RepID=UPI0037A7EA78
MSLRVRTDDARRLTVNAYSPEDYRIGSTVTVLEDGTWQRLAAEPYDAFEWQMLTLAAGLPDISLLATGVLARRRATALRRDPVPTLRVLERVDAEGQTWLQAADDTSGRTPLFTCFFTSAVHEASDPEIRDLETPGGKRRPQLDTRLHEAVLFGAPYDGSELLLVTTDADAHPVVLRTTGPARPPRTRTRQGSVTGVPSEQQLLTNRLATTLTLTDSSRSWGPGLASRAAGVALAAVKAVASGAFARTLAREGFAWGHPPHAGHARLDQPHGHRAQLARRRR